MRFTDKRIAVIHSACQKSFSLQRDWIEKQRHTDVSEFETETSEFVFNQGMIDIIEQNFPDDPIVINPQSIQHPKNGGVWVIDSIKLDEPTGYQFPLYRNSICYISDGSIQYSGILDPDLDSFYYAINGGGSYCNTNKMEVIQTEIGSISELDAREPNPLEDRLELFHYTSGNRLNRQQQYCANLSLALVASGELVGVLMKDVLYSEIAAGMLLVKESGGKLTDFNGENADSLTKKGPIVASNGLNHQKLLDIASEY